MSNDQLFLVIESMKYEKYPINNTKYCHLEISEVFIANGALRPILQIPKDIIMKDILQK